MTEPLPVVGEMVRETEYAVMCAHGEWHGGAEVVADYPPTDLIALADRDTYHGPCGPHSLYERERITTAWRLVEGS